MSAVGFNISKDKISYVVILGNRNSCKVLFHSVEKFDSSQPIPEMANYFKEAFAEIITKHKPDRISYRMSLESKKANIPYLYFSYGVLNLLAYEKGIAITQTISQSFSAKELGHKGDKFTVCDQIIDDIPSSKWNNDHRYAALAAWISLDA